VAKKKITLLLFFGFMSMSLLYAQKLTVRVNGIKTVSGDLMVGIFNSESSFPDVYYKGIKTEITNTVMTVIFSDLPKGKYAISVYQDLNKNGHLDKNIFGIPKEKYGFSNKDNALSYKKSLFNFDGDLTISITLK
jgi:uncharacterized protein (DUF2141 family)